MSQENQNIQEEPHKRRVRYKGKYPRNYKEKYCNVNFTALFNACDLLCIFNNVTLLHDMSQ